MLVETEGRREGDEVVKVVILGVAMTALILHGCRRDEDEEKLEKLEKLLNSSD